MSTNDGQLCSHAAIYHYLSCPCSEPPIHQVVFYQSGIGTENLYDKIVDGELSLSNC